MTAYWVRAVPAARTDAAAIGNWYRTQADDEVALGFAAEIRAAQVRLKSFPAMFRIVDAIGFRRIHLDHYPYVQWYWINEVEHLVLVLAITHNRQSDRTVREAVDRDNRYSAVPPPSVMPRLTTEQTEALLKERLAEARDNSQAGLSDQSEAAR
jgi:plasmid stabilization system protein ParE